jgi:predicted HicB family RNase H-like nuclease
MSKKVFTTTLEPDTIKKLRVEAAKRGININDLITKMINELEEE